ncbi:ArsA-related P-loop ATPase, partial [Angustibacter aerolatus]
MLVLTGGGGTGRTTVAAATAVQAAHHGVRTLLLGLDPDGGLDDVLDVPLPAGRPLQVAPRLDAVQVDGAVPSTSSGEAPTSDDDGLAAVARGVHEEVTALAGPALEQLLALGALARRSGHDLLVVDAGPTAHTVRLLGLAEAVTRVVDARLPAELGLLDPTPPGRAGPDADAAGPRPHVAV